MSNGLIICHSVHSEGYKRLPALWLPSATGEICRTDQRGQGQAVLWRAFFWTVPKWRLPSHCGYFVRSIKIVTDSIK